MHGQVVLTGGRLLQTRGGTGAHACDEHGEDDGGGADGHMLRVTDMAQRTLQVRVMGIVRRWWGGRTKLRNRACGLSGQGRAVRVQRIVAGAGGGHGEKVEGQTNGGVLQT